MRITRTLALTLALVALGGSAARAQPLDMHASTAIDAAKAQHLQDLRSPDARDVVRNPRNVGDAVVAGPPSWPTHPAPIASPARAASIETDPGVDWTGIAIGAGLAVAAMGGLAAFNSRHRPHRPRPVA